MKGKLGEAQIGIKIAEKNINNLRYTEDTTLMEESKEELKKLLMEMKESEKVSLKLNILKRKIVASIPWLHGKLMEKNIEIVTDLFSWTQKSLQMVTAGMKLKKK